MGQKYLIGIIIGLCIALAMLLFIQFSNKTGVFLTPVSSLSSKSTASENPQEKIPTTPLPSQVPSSLAPLSPGPLSPTMTQPSNSLVMPSSNTLPSINPMAGPSGFPSMSSSFPPASGTFPGAPFSSQPNNLRILRGGKIPQMGGGNFSSFGGFSPSPSFPRP